MVTMEILSCKNCNIADGVIGYVVRMLHSRDNIPPLLWSLGAYILYDLLAKLCPSLKSHTTT